MKKNPLILGALLLAGSLLLLGWDLGATTTFSELEADIYLSCEGNKLCESYELSMGDFDGDGFDDLLSPDPSYLTGLDFVVFGDKFPSGGSVASLRTTRIGNVPASSLPKNNIGDITGDGKADIFHFRGSGAMCDVNLGRPNPPAFISPPAGFTITGGSVISNNSIEFGDVNGDGFKDILFCELTAYVVFGSTSFQTFTSTLSVSDPTHVMKISGGDFGFHASAGDVDGDGFDDIIVAARTVPGNLYVIRGSTSLPSVWNIATSSASWTIVGDGVETLGVFFAADFTGDGKADLGLMRNRELLLLSGADLLSKGPVCVLTPGHSNSLTPTSIRITGYPNLDWSLPGDFDGDGRPDLCVTRLIESTGYAGGRSELSLILSHSFPVGSSLPTVFSQDSIQFKNYGRLEVLGDLNGDGKSDLIYKSETFPQLNVFYGFWPLENPRIIIQPRGSNQPRLNLSLSVNGEPTEMRISGDIVDTFKDQWIPYETSLNVTLTSSLGDKSVQAQFRNAFKRESALVQESLSLIVGTQHVTVRTNRVKAGGRATLDCSLIQTGRIKAAVFDQAGEKVVDLLDEEHAPGVWPVEWDGRNSEGNPVASGFYILIVEVAGQETKTTILVQR